VVLTIHVHNIKGDEQQPWLCAPSSPAPQKATHLQVQAFPMWPSYVSSSFVDFQAVPPQCQYTLLVNVLPYLLLMSPTSCCLCHLRLCLMKVDTFWQNGTALITLPSGQYSLGWWPCVAGKVVVPTDRNHILGSQ